MNWEGNHQPHQFTKDLFLDCTTVTVHAGKWLKALIDSEAISLMCMSAYNMKENKYKTSILPTAIYLSTADGSPMSSVGKATLDLQIADFIFSPTFIICDSLLETNDRLSGNWFSFWHQPPEKVFLFLLLGLGQTPLHTERRLSPDLHQKQGRPP